MKEQLQKRLLELEKEIHESTLNYNALLGARQEIFNLLHAENMKQQEIIKENNSSQEIQLQEGQPENG